MIDYPDSLGGPHFDPDLFRPGSPTRLHKGAEPPKPDRRAERDRNRLMQAQLRQARQQTKMPHIPAPPKLDPAPPPPQRASSDAIDEERDARRKSTKRTNAARNTIFGGETGGYLGGGGTLLG